MIRRIKIGVVANVRRKLHHDVLLFMKDVLAQMGIIAQRRIIGGEQFLDHFARFAPGGPAEREKFVQRLLDKDAPVLAFKFARFEMAVTFENGKVENVIADRDADAGR